LLRCETGDQLAVRAARAKVPLYPALCQCCCDILTPSGKPLERKGYEVVRTRMTRPYTILIADDDPILREVVINILQEPGYMVVGAADGYEAIRILADRHVDLIIADVRMPGLDGMQLGLQAKVMRPRLHVIYITGFAESAKKVRGGRVLQKPVRAAELIKHVELEIGIRD
jgi:CheY-like chemotaxis protein